MAGALAERDFVEKLERVGFTGIEIVAREPFGMEDAASYPLFTAELIELMRRTISPESQGRIATSVVVRAGLPRD